MPTKKEKIIGFLEEGKTTDEIVQLGFNKKYVNEVIRGYKKHRSIIQSFNIKKEINLTTMQSQKLLKKERIEEALKILNFINNDKLLENIEFEFSLKISTDQKQNEQKVNNNIKINPIELYRKHGESKLRQLLSTLNINQLKSIARQYTPDSRGYVYKWVHQDKIINYIIERSIYLSQKGNVFISDD